MKFRNGICVLISIITVIILSARTAAAVENAHNLLLLGTAASGLGRGATGVSAQGADMFFLNPASIATVRGYEASLQYGSLDGALGNPGIAAACATSYWSVGLAYQSVRVPNPDEGIGQAGILAIGMAKQITQRLMIGVGMESLVAEDGGNRHMAFGASIGGIYQIDIHRYFYQGLGIYRPSIGVSLHKAIIASKADGTPKIDQLAIGYTLPFYRHGPIGLSLYNDFIFIPSSSRVPVKTGVECGYRSFLFRVGCIIPDAYRNGALTTGLGYRLVDDDYLLNLDYALAASRDYGMLHYLGAGIALGIAEDAAPRVTIGADHHYISPNHDGRQDQVAFDLDVSGTSRIAGWKLQITDSRSQVVREFGVADRGMDDFLTPLRLLRRLAGKREMELVPARLVWDGADENGRPVPDGRYGCAFIAWDARGNISSPRRVHITVDTAPPTLAASAAETLFSPNNDGVRDLLNIRIAADPNTGQRCDAVFMDADSRVVRSFSWPAHLIPSFLAWDGRNDKGERLPDGVYSFRIEFVDRAGNGIIREIHDLSLVSDFYSLDINTSERCFSYITNRGVRLFPVFYDMLEIEDWKIIIDRGIKDPVRVIDGAGALPKEVPFNMKTADGERFDDGDYFYHLAIRLKNGIGITSLRKKIVVDNRPPRLGLDFSPSVFSPDNDTIDDVLGIFPRAHDPAGIEAWHLAIYAPSGETFASLSGRGSPPAVISWNGRGSANQLVESSVDYYLELLATDHAGNSSRSGRVPVPIDVLVLPADNGFKIVVSAIDFALGTAVLARRASPVLDRIAEVLDRYSRFKISVQGHTDDVGDDERNLRLSESRARTVMTELIRRGTDPGRLSFIGMGETSPLFPNTSVDNRRRNQRIEFILTGKDFLPR